MPRNVRLAISKIRRDGGTQGRCEIDGDVVRDYADLMAGGTEFPPVRIWFDGETNWLSDGFQRVAAAERIGLTEINAEIREGTLGDAQWDSYGANSFHGLRRSKTEVARAVQRALQHPVAAKLSNLQIAKHLGIPETTLRRMRHFASSPNGGDAVRIAVRAGKAYTINTSAIGKIPSQYRNERKGLVELNVGFAEMKSGGSPDAQRVLNVVGNWAFGPTTSQDCLRALEHLLTALKAPHGSHSASASGMFNR